MDHYKSLEPYAYGEQPLVPLHWLDFDHEEHEVCTFNEFPAVRGWDQTALQKLKSSRIDAVFCSETLPMLQSWLFLGALEAIHRQRIHLSDFIRIRKGKHVVSTKFLDPLFKAWRNSLGALSTVEKGVRAQEISEILSEVQFWCLKLGNWQENGEDLRRGGSVGVRKPPDAVDDVCILLTLAGETINCERTFLAESRALYRGFKGCYTAEGENRLIHQLVAHGWCPFMSRVLFTYRYSVAQYARFFNRKEPNWRSHKNCSPFRCIAYNVDEASYEPRHAVLGCDCSYAKPLLREVTYLINQGRIPVLFIDEKDPSLAMRLGSFKIGVASSSPENPIDYVAFSHVWSDGMGSVTEKGLPTCLIASLFERAYALNLSYVWIDSLCVPEEKQTRVQAILLMNTTYKHSAATVVLDSHIRQKRFDSRSTPLEVILLTLVTSPWMQRLWTLPEAVLPGRLVFQFQNTLATTKDIYDAIFDKSQRDFNPVIQSLSAEVFRILKHTGATVPEYERGLDLAEMLHMLRLRTTSRARDEVVAIADLLALDYRPLLAAETDLEEQRKLFFQSLGAIPRDIIFTPAPRMTSPGFRWAPLSFLSSDQTPDIRHSCATGTRTRLSQCLAGGGLRGEYQIILLSRTASFRDRASVTIRYRDILKKVIPSDKAIGVLEFDTLAMLPDVGSLQSLKVAAALTRRGESPAGISTYDYRGRVLVGEHTFWPTSMVDCIEMCTSPDGNCSEIILF
ncbi:hypothetical protein F4825DRAFT_214723 [Nemania diffusa]|nr:hypothetical protein F4825DRAFT_214723 [Nemania diffusa]